MPSKPKKPSVTSQKSAPYLVSVLTAGKEYNGSGESIAEALNQVKIDTFKAKAILQVEHDGRKKEIILQPPMLRKLVQPLNRIFFEKRLMLLLG